MQIDSKIHEEIMKAIERSKEDSFEFVASGGLKHFISCEGIEKGLYISAIAYGGKDFKIFMI